MSLLVERIRAIEERAKDTALPPISEEVTNELGGVLGALRHETGMSLEVTGHLLRAIKQLIREEAERAFIERLPHYPPTDEEMPF